MTNPERDPGELADSRAATAGRFGVVDHELAPVRPPQMPHARLRHRR